MAFLAPLAALLGVEIDVLVGRWKRNATNLAAVALLGIIGIAFLLVAANVALAEIVGPLLAPLILAGVATVSAAIVWFVSDASEKRRTRRAVERRRTTDTTALMTTAALTALPLLLKNPVLRILAVPASAAVGYFLLGRKGGRDDQPD